MSKPKIDYSGRTINNIKIIEWVEKSKNGRGAWKCICPFCNNEMFVFTSQLTKGNVKSCIECKNYVQRKLNVYEFYDDYVIGYTTNTNTPFYIDKEDFDKIKDYTWLLDLPDGYISTRIGVHKNGKYKQRHVKIHQIIMNTLDTDLIVDHININDRCDNRKSNLRVCTLSQNNINRTAQKNNKLGIKGVSKEGNKYVARIGKAGCVYIGRFNTLEEAVEARYKAEKEMYKEFAYNPYDENGQIKQRCVDNE